MARISIDNGIHFTDAAEALKSIDFSSMVPYMDDDTREAVNAELAPCTELEFLERYLDLAPEDLIVG